MRGLIEDLSGDLSYAVRTVIRNPGFAAVVIGALALGIGANLTVFTIANAFLFKNLPFADSDRILYMANTVQGRSGTRSVSYPDYLEYRQQAHTFDGIAAFVTRSVDLSDGTGFPERFRGALLSANAFAVIGQSPVRGRDFVADDERPGAPPVAIVSDSLWQGRYARDPSIVGRTIRINDTPTLVVGVMGRGLTFPGATTIWMPLVRTPDSEKREVRTLTLFGRLAPRAGIAAARAEISAIAGRLAESFPSTNRNVGVLVQNFSDRFNGSDTKLVLRSLLGAVGFVLLIACANAANLLLARAVDRTREVSIRTTLGASRWRVVRQLLVENLLLSFVAGVCGLLLAIWGVRVFDASLVPAVKPPYVDFSMDATVFAYLAAITFAATLVFGLAPSLQLWRLDLNAAMKEGSNAAGRGRAARLLSGLLVVVEVGLAVVLLAGAGVMLRSLLNTARADIGVETANVMSMTLNLRAKKYPRVEDQVLFQDQLKRRLETIPGMEVVAVASDLPAESPDDYTYEIEGAPEPVAGRRPRSAGLVVGTEYFHALRVAIASGRPFTDQDTAASQPVAIVNQMFARRAWPGRPAVGKQLRLLDGPRGPAGWLTVVGVAVDVLQDDESFEQAPVIYLAFRQFPQRGMEIVMRTRVAPTSLGHAIRQEVQALDEDLAVPSLRTLDESLWLRNWRYRVFGSMFGVFAAVALLLASVGLYAVIAHSVSRRTREIGLRMALGAVSRSIVGLVFRQGFLPLGIGLAVGLAGALAATRVLESMLVGITAADPLTFAAVSAVLLAAGALGCAIPARRAIRVDPVVALRNE